MSLLDIVDTFTLTLWTPKAGVRLEIQKKKDVGNIGIISIRMTGVTLLVADPPKWNSIKWQNQIQKNCNKF